MKNLLKVLFGIDIDLLRKFQEWKREQIVNAYGKSDWKTAEYINQITWR